MIKFKYSKILNLIYNNLKIINDVKIKFMGYYEE